MEQLSSNPDHPQNQPIIVHLEGSKGVGGT